MKIFETLVMTRRRNMQDVENLTTHSLTEKLDFSINKLNLATSKRTTNAGKTNAEFFDN